MTAKKKSVRTSNKRSHCSSTGLRLRASVPSSLALGEQAARNWRQAAHILVLDVLVVEPGDIYEKLVAHGQHLDQRQRIPLEPRERLLSYLHVHTLEAVFQPQDFVRVAQASARVPVRVHLVNAPVLHVRERGKLRPRHRTRSICCTRRC